MKPIISVKSLSIQKENKTILQDISFQIQKGEYIGLIGPNGAGKTTLLKTIMGLNKPKTGQLSLPNPDEIGYVPQKNAHSLNSPISVEEILATGLKHNPFWLSSQSKNKIVSAIKKVNLSPEILRKNFQNLSGGQQQRVLIARSLINQPSLILFDEPFNGVDQPTQNKIYNLLQDLNESGVTIIFVSHDINTITEKCDRVLCLDKTLHEGCHPIFPEFKTKCSHGHAQVSTNQDQLPIHHHNHS